MVLIQSFTLSLILYSLLYWIVIPLSVQTTSLNFELKKLNDEQPKDTQQQYGMF